MLHHLKKLCTGLLIFCAVFCGTIGAASGQLRPAGVFGNNAVFQQGIPIPVWGKAMPGAVVNISFANQEWPTTADEKGNWQIALPAMKADGKEYLLQVKSGTEQFSFSRIMLGEVWLASGQSNMAHKIGSELLDQAAEIQAANYPDIRFRTVDHLTAIVPTDDIPQKDWKVCNPQNVGDFSSVAYFFARGLHLDQKVPVGIIVSAKGATSIESWMSRERLMTHPDYIQSLSKRDEDTSHWNSFVKQAQEAEAYRERMAATSFRGLALGVTTLAYNDSAWGKTAFPLTATKMGYGSYWGLLWLRKTFELTPQQCLKRWKLFLPVKDQNDIVYLNEKESARGVSKLSPKTIALAPGSLKAGQNILAIRLYANWGIADIGDRNTGCYLEAGDGEKVDLTGIWTHSNKIEPVVAGWQDFYNKHTVNFNAMISPLIPYGIRGFLWYQGENNASRAKTYAELQPMMIDDWRVRWKQGYLPFLFVQLAGYKARSAEPVAADDWAQLRDAQTATLWRSPNTGMACTIDIGDEFNIHPVNKQEVGKRLYRAAQQIVYHQDVLGSGPLFKSATLEGDWLRLRFSGAQNGLTARDGSPIRGFALADAGGKWVWANARIDCNDVLVSTREVPVPLQVQYAWQSNPEAPVYSQADLPMVPFNEKLKQ